MVPAGRTPTGDAAAVFAGPGDQRQRPVLALLLGQPRRLLHPLRDAAVVVRVPVRSASARSTHRSRPIPRPSAASRCSSATPAWPNRAASAPPRARGRGSMIDGLNAYTPGAIKTLTSIAGFEPLSYTPHVQRQPRHGRRSPRPTVPMICDPPATFPPTTSTCPALHDSGIQIQQTTTLLPGRSGGARDATLHERRRQEPLGRRAVLAVGRPRRPPAQTPGFQFPGQGSFATHRRAVLVRGVPARARLDHRDQRRERVPPGDVESDRRDHLQPAAAERRLRERRGRADGDVPDALRRHRAAGRLGRLRLVLLAGRELRQPGQRSSRSSATGSATPRS